MAPGEWSDADCVPPHDLTDKPAVWPTGKAAPKLQALMDASREVVSPGMTGRQARELFEAALRVGGEGREPDQRAVDELAAVLRAVCDYREASGW